MFNLNERKACIGELANSIVGGEEDGSENNGLAGEALSVQSVLRIEDLALFKMADFRLLFVSKCLHTHYHRVLDGKDRDGTTPLPRGKFDLLTDIFRVILREANNEGDFLSVRTVFFAANIFGMKIGDYFKPIKLPLKKHEVWRNGEFWRSTLDDLIARDKQEWMRFQPHLQGVLQFEASIDDLVKLMVVLRLRSLVRTCLEYRVPAPVIESILEHVRDCHGVLLSPEEISEPTHTGIILWLLDLSAKVAIERTARESESPGNFEQSSSSRMGRSRSVKSVTQVVRWATDTVTQARHAFCLGYSTLHELLSFAVQTRVRSRSPWSPQSEEGWGGGFKGRGKEGTCLCCRPYEEWKTTGGLGWRGDQGLGLNTIPNFLCEVCFRYSIDKKPMVLETVPVHEGTLLATLRLPLVMPSAPIPVGRASLPGCEMRAPMNLSAFWTKQADVPHRRKNSRDRLAKKQQNQPPPSPQPVPPKAKEVAPPTKTLKSNNIPPPIKKDSEIEEFRSILTVGIDVMKHGRLGRPKLRTLFIDQNNNQLYWCDKTDTMKSSTSTPGTIKAEGRAGLALDCLKEVRVTNERKRCMQLTFTERALIIEATSSMQMTFLLNGFRGIVYYNRIESR